MDSRPKQRAAKQASAPPPYRTLLMSSPVKVSFLQYIFRASAIAWNEVKTEQPVTVRRMKGISSYLLVCCLISLNASLACESVTLG